MKFVLECCPNQFKCDSVAGFGKCLPTTCLDNGIIECHDRSDESSEIGTCIKFFFIKIQYSYVLK